MTATGRKKKGSRRTSYLRRPFAGRRGRSRSWAKLVQGKNLRIAALAAAAVAVLAAFVLLDRYIRKGEAAAEDLFVVELVDVPFWVEDSLTERVVRIAQARRDDPSCADEIARLLQRSIAGQMAWLRDAKVRVANDRIIVEGRWRKPLAMLRIGRRRFYVDASLTVLDYVPLPKLPVVEVTLGEPAPAPALGAALQRQDLAAALAILDRMNRMDALVSPDKPLLEEIAGIDVRNLDGCQDPADGHIVLYTEDGTRIIWGARLGTWQRYLEAPDEEKLAKLYDYYRAYGSPSGGAKYIDLRPPQNDVLRPADRY